jgi:hypothetical protein
MVSIETCECDLDIHPNLVHQWRRMFMAEGVSAFVDFVLSGSINWGILRI